MQNKRITVQDLKEIALKNGLYTNPKTIKVGNDVKKLDRFELIKNKSRKLLDTI